MTNTTYDKTFVNKHGSFRDGDEVFFRAENHISSGWKLGSIGTLFLDNDEWKIKVGSHVVTINKGYDAYSETIEHADSEGQ